jgi:iron(III) transport system substrate-binding protein
MTRDIGWDFFEQLAKQNIMQVQSSTDPPKKLSLGERSVMADGNEYNIFLLRESGQPVEAVYPTEGTPFVIGPNGIFKAAPNPSAAKLFQNYCFTPEAQAMIIDVGGLRSLHAQVKEHPDRTPLSDIKIMKEDAEGAEKQSEAIKAHYQKIFHV